MDLPTVSSLCAGIPHVLAPAPGFSATALEVSAVHISELPDPTDYLSGMELLLTTGLSLPDSEIGIDRYVSRLAAARVSALGLGLGPSLTTVPDALAAACQRHDICLLVVPPAAAFLTITQAYWVARSRSTQRELTDAITAHRSLVDAMVSRDPVGETLKALSRSLGAWVARLDPAGAVEHVFPSARIPDALAVAGQIEALRASGVHSSAAFPLHDETVAVFPLPLEDRVVGYIAIGSVEPLNATDRRLVLTAGALLSLDSLQRQRADAAVQSEKQAVVTLLDMGFVEPARRLASRAGLAPFRDTVRVLVVRSRRSPDITDAVHSWSPDSMPGRVEGALTWFVMPWPGTRATELSPYLLRADDHVAAVWSDPVALDRIHPVRTGLSRRVATLDDGMIAFQESLGPSSADVVEGLRRVLDHPRPDLTSTLVAYLRHRGQVDATARDLGVHRNTVRHRMDAVRDLLGVDPDDADAAADMWVSLRGRGVT